jgi:hypothetical protein
MDFSKIAIKNDIYLFYWIYYLKPILNKNKIYENFIEINNKLGIKSNVLHNDNIKYIKIQTYKNSKEQQS